MPDELAGQDMQCPQCGLLNTVPTSEELKQLNFDGTFLVGEALSDHEQGRLDEMIRVYGGKKAGHGEIDLRQIAQNPQSAEPIPLEEAPIRVARRYDPETGELVQPFDIKPDDSLPISPGDVPMATRVLPYAVGLHEPKGGAAWALVSLFQPVNLVVIFFVLLAHLPVIFILSLPLLGFDLLLSPVFAVGAFAMMAHLVGVIIQTGPEERDELPRFLGDLSFTQDFWNPFVSATIALVFCYGIPVLLLSTLHLPYRIIIPISLSLAAIGTLMFPAVLLTAATSGSLHNLRPDRPWKVIGAIGLPYVLLVILYIASVVIYFLGFVSVLANMADHLRGVTPHILLYRTWVAYPILILGVLMAHYFCWMLGLAYRAYYARFPWVLQVHHHAPPVLPGLRATPPNQTASHPK